MSLPKREDSESSLCLKYAQLLLEICMPMRLSTGNVYTILVAAYEEAVSDSSFASDLNKNLRSSRVKKEMENLKHFKIKWRVSDVLFTDHSRFRWRISRKTKVTSAVHLLRAIRHSMAHWYGKFKYLCCEAPQ